MNIQSSMSSTKVNATMALPSRFYLFGVVVLVLLTTLTGKAQTTLYDVTDAQVSSSGVTNPTTIWSGYYGTPQNSIFVFQMPTLAAGQQFSAANLSLYLDAPYGSPSFNEDVYGLIPSAVSAITTAGYFTGAADPNSTRVQPAFYNSSSSAGRNTSTSTALATYLNNAYDNGAGAGKYLFFRVNPAASGTNYTGYVSYSGAVGYGAYYWPELSYSTSAIGWSTVPLGGGGFVIGLVSDGSGNDIYCRSDAGGAFRWDPANAVWNSITDHIVPVTTPGVGSLSGIVSLAVDPSNSNQIYVAAGSNGSNSTSPNPNPDGIYSSSDHGNTWTKINLSTSINMFGNGTFRPLGERLAVDPNNSNTVWFGSSNAGLYKGTNSSGTWTWAQIPSSSVPFGSVPKGENAGVPFVICDKNNGSTIVYAGVYDSVGGSGGVYMNTGGGSTWSKVGGAAALPTPLRAALATGNGTLYVCAGTSGAAKMARGGGFSQLSSLPTGINYQGVTTDSTGTIVYVAEANLSTQQNRIFYSANGGTSWAEQSGNIANSSTREEPDGTLNVTGYWFGDISSLLLNPANSNELFAADLFGAYWSPDPADLGGTPGCYWYTIQKNQEETVVASLKNAPSGPRLVAGLGDVGGFIYNNITQRPYGSAGFALSNPLGGNNVSFDFCEGNNNNWATAWDQTEYIGTGATSTDGGNTWIPFGGIAVQKLTNTNSPATATWDLSTYLAKQKAAGTNTVTLVLAAYKPGTSGNNMTFDSTTGGTPPKLIINGTATLTPTADSYTNSQAAGTNYGTSSSLAVCCAYGNGLRFSYLMFDLSSVSSITSATLQLNRQATSDTETFTVGVYGCTNTSWTQAGITYANEPVTLASNGDPIAYPSYYVGSTHLQGGRIAISATNAYNMVWMPEGTSNYPYYSTDRGVTWTVCSGAPHSQMTSQYVPGPILQQLASDRVNGNFYVAQFDAAGGNDTVYVSTNGGATFTVAGTANGTAYNPYRSQLVAGPGIAGDLWISDDGVSISTNGGLWHSTNGGGTWAKQSNLTAVSEVTFGAPKPGSGQPYSMYINGYKSTVRGIYRSDDGGSTWNALSAVPTVDDIETMAGDRQNYGYVFLGTGGRGMWIGH